MNHRLLMFPALACLSASPVLGQVGHDPANSPYKDLRISQTITFLSGRMSGGTGKALVGPSNGPVFGVRWDFHVGGAATVFAGGSLVKAERNLVDPDDPPATRYFGTADQDLVLIEGGFNLLLTGRKTWHGLVPYFGASMGLVAGSAVPQDSSGFRFANKFLVGPMIGIRFFPTRRIHFRVEAHDVLWRLSYTGTRFFNNPANDPTSPPVLDRTTTKSAEWVHHPVLRFGIGWTLRM